ncbi:hypothetical protein VTH8203_00825 [Vibrio thalassae]|uniref:Transposase zinc-binding domain-containing protein n=1 Tax=Vibrio thalassae TaxID=1243014 RepID=A0A240EEW6_9VIBR|nr:hypothetical protein [Vibrio thalassae]SNX47224.1 hypothetical protein VTH8203_00825 [Vibrio thalassae]
MYQREKRKFVSAIIGKYKELKRPVGKSRYSQEYRRLRDYAELLFIKTGKMRISLLQEQDLLKALLTTEMLPEHKPQFEYVVALARCWLTREKAQPFYGEFQCYCGGSYSANANGYHCSKCGYKGYADQHGFPISMPGNAQTCYLRRQYHKEIDGICSCGANTEEAYQMVAFEMKLPLPMLHAGLITSPAMLREMVNAAKAVKKQLMLARAS